MDRLFSLNATSQSGFCYAAVNEAEESMSLTFTTSMLLYAPKETSQIARRSLCAGNFLIHVVIIMFLLISTSRTFRRPSMPTLRD
ncbi:hypothetical protein SLE2022_040530 [Rubroshorea leprosula]